MNRLVAQIEKWKPFFEKISKNTYLSGIKNGFVACMPIVVFSSIFLLIAYVPNIFNFYWPEAIEAVLLKPYNFTMGFLAVGVAATTAKSVTESFNRDMPKTNQISTVATMLAAICGILMLATDPIEGGISTSYLGSSGLLAAFVVAFVTSIVYRFCVKRNITIRLPEEVPPNISQAFKDIIPFGFSIIIFWLFELGFRNLTGVNFAQGVIQFFQPLFTAADGWIGLAVIYGAMAFFWFIGIHGPSIVEPAVSAIYYVNIAANISTFQAGNHATDLLTPGLQYFVATLGGTGATFVVPFLFIIFAKSKANKAVGKAAVIPTSFGVNEPILFGAPLVLNPVFFVPFILAPIVNVWLFKAFVDFLGMNSFLYVLPWTFPGPIGLVMGTGFSPMSFVLAIALVVVDGLIYYPFFKAYDLEKYEEEQKNEDLNVESALDDVITSTNNLVNVVEELPSETEDEVSVLVVCAGGGTSGLLANALNKGAKEHQMALTAAATSWGVHQEMLPDYDLVVLAPQVATNLPDLKKDTDRLNIEAIATEGREYITLTRDPEKALNFVSKILKQRKNKQMEEV
ncbi:lactose-specific PTS transporter subunit EIIC [Enterococcus sp. AZ103]|uniref:lactose-specific PTS transporter subunit EIIC n=1 Tax=Enterococcus sp. AZ103 TaxID=2774628 RepID=UPI003F236AC2